MFFKWRLMPDLSTWNNSAIWLISQPDRLALQPNFDAGPAVPGLVEQELSAEFFRRKFIHPLALLA